MSEGIEVFQYVGNRKKDPTIGLSASLGEPSKQKRSFIPDEPQIQQYGFQNLAMMIPENTMPATYVSAASIK